MRRMVTNNKGFSLVELMVVVAIIGILAAIAVPNFQKFTAKSKQTEAKSDLSALYSAERAFAAEWNTFFEDFRVVGYQPTGDLRYNHGFSSGTAKLPTNYNNASTGMPGPGASATAAFNTEDTTNICSQGSGMVGTTSSANALSCRLITSPVTPVGALSSLGATADAPNHFLAAAAGDIDGDKTLDTWTINSAKELQNTVDDLNQ